MKRLFFSSFLGGMSIFLLFLPLNSISLFFFKFGISIILVLIAFKYQSFRYTAKNIIYLYIVSLFLGGSLYVLNCNFSYKQEGLIFYHSGLSINVIVLIMISPFILYTYYKEMKDLKNKYNQLYEIEVVLKDRNTLHMTAFLDTGNHLKDPFLNRPIIVMNDPKILLDEKFILVPFHTILNQSFLKCYEVDHVKIDGQCLTKNVLLGISPAPIKMEGVDCIIGTKVLEG